MEEGSSAQSRFAIWSYFALLWFWLNFFNCNVFCHLIFFTLTINFLNSIHGWVNWIKCLTKALNTHEMGLTRVYIYTLNQWFSKSIIDLILTLYQGIVKIKENPPRYQSEVSCIFKCWPGFSFLKLVDFFLSFLLI